MPKMIPPHYNGVRHAGRILHPGEAADVADIDVSALEAEGWVKGPGTKAGTAKLDQHAPDDDVGDELADEGQED